MPKHNEVWLPVQYSVWDDVWLSSSTFRLSCYLCSGYMYVWRRVTALTHTITLNLVYDNTVVCWCQISQVWPLGGRRKTGRERICWGETSMKRLAAVNLDEKIKLEFQMWQRDMLHALQNVWNPWCCHNVAVATSTDVVEVVSSSTACANQKTRQLPRTWTTTDFSNWIYILLHIIVNYLDMTCILFVCVSLLCDGKGSVFTWPGFTVGDMFWYTSS